MDDRTSFVAIGVSLGTMMIPMTFKYQVEEDIDESDNDDNLTANEALLISIS